MKHIAGLPGFYYVYKGKTNPWGITVTTRKAYNPLTGEILTERARRTRVQGGISYEEKRRQTEGDLSQRKTSGTVRTQKRQVKNLPNYYKVTGFTELSQILEYYRSPENAIIILHAVGALRDKRYGGVKRSLKREHLTLHGRIFFGDLKKDIKQVVEGKAKSPAAKNIVSVMEEFSVIESYYLMVQK